MNVVFKSTGQGFPIYVPVLFDYADGVRVRQKPLPQIGTWGLVAFPYGDIRNGVWLGSYYPSQIDALTTTQPNGHAVTDPFIDYESHFSGHWWLRDGLGNFAQQWPDGSFFTAAAASGLPTTYRHTVVNNQQQQVVFPQTERIPSPPSGFYFEWQHKSGTLFTCDPSGNVTVSGAPGTTLTFDFGLATVVMASGNVNINVPGSDTLNVSQAGMSVADAAVLTSKMVSAFNAFVSDFNAHTHPVTGVMAGSNTVPTSPPSSSAASINAGTIESAVAKLSN